ncbi:hypothetical protein BCR33DRAFT_714636 [Rhizoclosmatium globosum]|uniref:Uncharacterized protein n=1 Tax=Rhizoclosmatium globosum TaxID=329046 RepID=A0A1Y2CMP9_9FUNG|nr:hypothetical protein BCR33DRAFT_714636 [Rhizoclosmatium globosum]|eukprot:ORY48237.1 hypothetical protein BCR33DRAFT_714636 [Rhizoclosmatium globosum]
MESTATAHCHNYSNYNYSYNFNANNNGQRRGALCPAQLARATFDEITQTFDVIGACVQRGLIRDAIDVLKELMDRIVVHVEQLGLAHSRPSQATNPNLPLQNSVQDSNAVIPVPAQFWNQVNSLFLRLLVALRAESAQMDEWEWIHENVMGWIEILRWFGLVDYELGFWGQDILQAIEMGKMTCVMQRQAAEPQQQ